MKKWNKCLLAALIIALLYLVYSLFYWGQAAGVEDGAQALGGGIDRDSDGDAASGLYADRGDLQRFGNAAEPTRLRADGRYPVCGGDGPVSDVFLFRRRGDDHMLHRICTDEDIRLRAIRLFSFAPGFDLRYNRKRNERGSA